MPGKFNVLEVAPLNAVRCFQATAASLICGEATGHLNVLKPEYELRF